MRILTSESKKTDMSDSVSVFIFLWMTIAVPLYIENRYFNILQAKGHAFDVGCIAGALLIVFSVLSNKCVGKLRPKAEPTDIGLAVMACTAIISCLISGSFKAAFWGEQGWCVGGFAFLMAAFLYLYLSKSFYFSQNCWFPMILANVVIFIIGILHSTGIDVLGMHKNIDPTQFYQYISTIGNVNWYSGYLCLLIPMFACFFIESKSIASQIIYFVILALGEINMVLTGCDSLMLGIGVCAFFAVPCMFRSKSSTLRFSALVMMYGFISLLVAIHPAFAEKREAINGLSALFFKPIVYIGLMALGLAGMLIFHITSETAAKKLCRVIIIAAEISLGIVTIYFAYKTICSFGVRWGSYRGSIWIRAIEVFAGLEPIKKVFGVGPEMLGLYFREMPVGLTRKVLAAHSEPLQILLSMGIAGITGWILMWAGIISRFFRNRLWGKPTMAFFLPLMAYLGQSLVNTPMATNFGILIVMVSLFVYYSDNEL